MHWFTTFTCTSGYIHLSLSTSVDENNVVLLAEETVYPIKCRLFQVLGRICLNFDVINKDPSIIADRILASRDASLKFDRFPGRGRWRLLSMLLLMLLMLLSLLLDLDSLNPLLISDSKRTSAAPLLYDDDDFR